jgi:signal transduction histidine kinase
MAPDTLIGIDMSDRLLFHLMDALDTVVLERLAPNEFSIVSPPTRWFTALWPESNDHPARVSPGQVFPFLENFLIDAERFWASPGEGQIKSGIWSEVDDQKQEYHLEATALSTEQSQVLLIAFPQMEYREKFHILQKGREIHLEYDRMLKEIQKKEVLLHCIIHDLKGPLAVMNGVFGVAEDATLPLSDLRDLMRLGQDHVSRQERLIKDVLETFSGDVDALETFADNAEDAPNILFCAQSVVDGLKPAFARRDIALTIEADMHEDWRVIGDQDHLERIFSNLLENALRYTPAETTVCIGLEREGSDILAYVDDRGPGVPDQLKSHLFDKFVHGQQRPSSSGIGLFFCRITVERWGGLIGVDARTGGGSHFWFRLPRPRAQ